MYGARVHGVHRLKTKQTHAPAQHKLPHITHNGINGIIMLYTVIYMSFCSLARNKRDDSPDSGEIKRIKRIKSGECFTLHVSYILFAC